MLDDLARAFACDRGLVAAYDGARRSLRGIAAHGTAPELIGSLEVRLDGSSSVLATALESGTPQRISDVAGDPRLDGPTRGVLLEAGFGRTVVVPVRGADGGPLGVLALSRRTPFGQSELRALAAIADRAVSREAAGRAPTESNAVAREWLWWMVNAVDDPVVVTDDNNEIVMRNDRAEILFRAHEGDSEGRRHAVWMNNFLFTAALSSWQLEPTARQTSREVTLVDPIEGTEVVFEVLARPARNYRDGSRGVVAVLKDVTQLRHVHEELERGRLQLQSIGEAVRVERDRLGLILHGVPNPIVLLDGEDPTTLNPAAARLFGRDPERSGRARAAAVANWTRLVSFVGQRRLEPGSAARGEVVLTDPENDERLEMAVTLGEVRDVRGESIGAVAVLQDIGQLRELERRRLEQVLFESEKLAATGRLAASIAHELNNPLEAIGNSLYVLVERTSETDPDHAFLDIARKETARMSRILRQMLGFYRPAPEMGDVDLNALFIEAEGLLAKRLRDRRIVVVRDLDPALPIVRASGDQLKQVLLNLILNASDAMPDGGTVTVTTAEAASSLVGLPESRHVQLQVRDEGLGISEEDLPRIFEPFFSTKGKRSSGLGLWVSYGIVQSHGGTLQARSTPGRGTTFTVVLPIAGPEPAPPALVPAGTETSA